MSRHKRLSIQQIRRQNIAKKRRIKGELRGIELTSKSETESETGTETEKETVLKPNQTELTQSALGDSLADFSTWLSTKTSSTSVTRNLSHVTALFCWLSNSLSIGEAAMFGKLVFIPLLIFNIFLISYQYP
jgi:hypothetical protein